MRPDVQGSSPRIARARAVFPEAFGPSIAHCCPSRICQLVSGKISRFCNRTVIRSRSRSSLDEEGEDSGLDSLIFGITCVPLAACVLSHAINVTVVATNACRSTAATHSVSPVSGEDQLPARVKYSSSASFSAERRSTSANSSHSSARFFIDHFPKIMHVFHERAHVLRNLRCYELFAESAVDIPFVPDTFSASSLYPLQ